MSGIVGCFDLQRRPVEPAVFAPMVAILAHRGRDGCGVWYDDGIALGHQMLHTTPESRHERFPMASARTSLHLVADARIDNREELIARLDVAPNDAGTITDAAIVMAAYERWGAQCPTHIVGAYAFALWDASRRTLVCARDHYGLKPLFYSYLPDRHFVFASEAKAVLHHPDVPRALNERAVAEHLLAPVEGDATTTFFRHVRRLEPGHVLTVDQRGIRQHRYWSFDPETELRLGSDEAYAEALRTQFEEAVRCRMRSVGEVGAMLSGGIDSSSIVGVAAPLCASGGRPLHTFSAVFDTVKQSDERDFIEAVLLRYAEQTEPHFITADALDPLTDFSRVLWHQDSAVEAGNFYINWTLHAMAREQGVRVLLDGFDGDTTLSHGMGYLHELATSDRWLTLYREVKAQTQRAGHSWPDAMWRWVKTYKIQPGAGGWAAFRLAGSVAQRLHRRRVPAGQPGLTWRTALSPAFGRQVEGLLAHRPPPPATEREDHYRLLTRPMMYRVVELLEASAAAASVDLRLPFCDRRLMAFCLSLPPTQKRSGGWTRIAMRRAMQGILPQTVQWRLGKGDLGPGFDHGLLVHAGQRLREMTERDTGGIGRFVDLGALRTHVPRYENDRASQPTHIHWRALSLALWLRQTGL